MHSDQSCLHSALSKASADAVDGFDFPVGQPQCARPSANTISVWLSSFSTVVNIGVTTCT